MAIVASATTDCAVEMEYQRLNTDLVGRKQASRFLTIRLSVCLPVDEDR